MEETSSNHNYKEAAQRHPHPLPDRKVDALLEIEDLTSAGMNVRDAVAEVAKKTGMGERTLFSYRIKTNLVPRTDWAAVLARKGYPNRPKAKCHPEALRVFIDLCWAGVGAAESFRRMQAEAKLNDWAPIPSARTLERELDRQLPKVERRAIRRDAQPIVRGPANV
jgi:hypothetical protein